MGSLHVLIINYDCFDFFNCLSALKYFCPLVSFDPSSLFSNSVFKPTNVPSYWPGTDPRVPLVNTDTKQQCALPPLCCLPLQPNTVHQESYNNIDDLTWKYNFNQRQESFSKSVILAMFVQQDNRVKCPNYAAWPTWPQVQGAGPPPQLDLGPGSCKFLT